MATTMVRTTVKLPAAADTRLRHEAARRNTTVSALVREAIESYLGLGPRRRLLSAGAGSGDETDVSERIDEILAAEWVRSH